MVKIKKILFVISICGLFVFLYGCEKQTKTKENDTGHHIVSRVILPRPSKKIEEKPIPQPGSVVSAKENQAPIAPETGAKKMIQIPSGVVTTKLLKKIQAVAGLMPGRSGVAKVAPGYDSTGKLNPFLPLFQEKEVVNLDIDEKPKRMLTPLEKIDLSQIKLVAVILMKKRQLAMVEETTGKGYEVRLGTYMGKNSGQVSKINQSSIVVKEYVKDYKGKRQVHFREIKLHNKESGE
ncbi:MAG: pilus assembly protein PilP [Desulfobacteraceae bacterium]|nr:pilus assembly protein PilP [Desulfobacteraceae bacterium]